MKTIRIHSRLSLSFLLILILSFILFSCNKESNKDTKGKPKYVETMNSGRFTAYIDESISKLLYTPIQWYRKDYPKVDLTIVTVSSREAMKKLLAGEARVILISRGYLRDEDSLMKKFKVKPHHREPLADDGLVLFTQKEFTLDTINAEQLYKIVTDKNYTFKSYFPNAGFTSEPQIMINSYSSSEYANFQKLVARNKQINYPLSFVNGSDSVILSVKVKRNIIGIAFLSQVVRDTSLKFIRVGFADSTGKYIRPKPVHQGYIVQGLYPYKVTHWAYLLEDRRNLPFWFSKFLAVEENVQRYFLNAGIVPAFARIKLVPEE